MCNRLECKYTYVNKTATLIIEISRRYTLWSYEVFKFDMSEKLMSGYDDVVFSFTKRECKDRMIAIFGEIIPLSEYEYKRRNDENN